MSVLRAFENLSALKILSIDILRCSHERCAEYFMESIQSALGFYGWKCDSYFKYVLDLCPFDGNDMTVAGENCESTSRGMFLVNTNSKYPFAKGRADVTSDDQRAKRGNSVFKSHKKGLWKHLMKISSDFKGVGDTSAHNETEEILRRFIPKVMLIINN